MEVFPMDSLGYFGKWFPTEHKKYTAIIAMMYVGVVTTVTGVYLKLPCGDWL